MFKKVVVVPILGFVLLNGCSYYVQNNLSNSSITGPDLHITMDKGSSFDFGDLMFVIATGAFEGYFVWHPVLALLTLPVFIALYMVRKKQIQSIKNDSLRELQTWMLIPQRPLRNTAAMIIMLLITLVITFFLQRETSPAIGNPGMFISTIIPRWALSFWTFYNPLLSGIGVLVAVSVVFLFYRGLFSPGLSDYENGIKDRKLTEDFLQDLLKEELPADVRKMFKTRLAELQALESAVAGFHMNTDGEKGGDYKMSLEGYADAADYIEDTVWNTPIVVKDKKDRQLVRDALYERNDYILKTVKPALENKSSKQREAYVNDCIATGKQVDEVMLDKIGKPFQESFKLLMAHIQLLMGTAILLDDNKLDPMDIKDVLVVQKKQKKAELSPEERITAFLEPGISIKERFKRAQKISKGTDFIYSDNKLRFSGISTETQSIPQFKNDGSVVEHSQTMKYLILKSDNEDIARNFLEAFSVDADFHYLVVETPEGNFGRDINGIYEE